MMATAKKRWDCSKIFSIFIQVGDCGLCCVSRKGGRPVHWSVLNIAAATRMDLSISPRFVSNLNESCISVSSTHRSRQPVRVRVPWNWDKMLQGLRELPWKSADPLCKGLVVSRFPSSHHVGLFCNTTLWRDQQRPPQAATWLNMPSFHCDVLLLLQLQLRGIGIWWALGVPKREKQRNGSYWSDSAKVKTRSTKCTGEAHAATLSLKQRWMQERE